jgi:hypothetical protein
LDIVVLDTKCSEDSIQTRGSEAEMAKGPSLRQLVDRHAATELIRRGFVYDPSGRLPTFRRHKVLPAVRVVQLIEFQSGVKMGSFGTFTVNLGVYSPEWTTPPRGVSPDEAHSWNCMIEMWMRLGHLAPPARPHVLGRLLGISPAPSGDKWWPYRGQPADVERVFAEVVGLLVGEGQEWLDRSSTADAFQTARKVRDARVERLKGHGA